MHSQKYPDLIGSVEHDIGGNVYLHLEDPSHQENVYFEKSFDDGTLLFSTQDEDSDLLCLKIKKK